MTGITIIKAKNITLRWEKKQQMKILDGSIENNVKTYETRIKNSSFLLKIKYNQNHSIQGTIQWLEQKKTIYFRSLMELVLLLQEAASNNMEFRSWNGEKGIIKELLSPKQPTGSE